MWLRFSMAVVADAVVDFLLPCFGCFAGGENVRKPTPKSAIGKHVRDL